MCLKSDIAAALFPGGVAEKTRTLLLRRGITPEKLYNRCAASGFFGARRPFHHLPRRGSTIRFRRSRTVSPDARPRKPITFGLSSAHLPTLSVFRSAFDAKYFGFDALLRKR